MTIREKLEEIIDKRIVIHCEENWMSEVLFDKLNIQSDTCWEKYKGEMCYIFCNNRYCKECVFSFSSIGFYESQGYEIIKFTNLLSECEDYDKEKNLLEIKNRVEELSFLDVSEILNEKYGENRWVIK